MHNKTTETTPERKTDNIGMLKLPGGNAANAELLAKAAVGDIDALMTLDRHGFVMGKSESPEEVVARLGTLADKLAKMQGELDKTGKFEIDGVTVEAKDRIPDKLFGEAREMTSRLFGFAIDWVPGFFIDPFFLFGGCAFTYFPDFFAMFIIRRSFKQSPKWFIYKRKELLAHELCHIARIGLESERFEETFAYQTATSPFRRLLGGLFLKPMDSYLLLTAAFLLLIGQLLRTYLFPALPIAPFWGFLALSILWLSLRYIHLMNLLKRAKANMELLWGGNAMKALFRCTDDEIRSWAAFKGKDDAQAWLDGQGVRWKVITSLASVN